MRVLFSDNLHLNNKNFASLLSYLNQIDAEIYRPDFSNEKICQFGDYSSWDEIITLSAEISTLPAEQLMALKCKGVSLFNVCQAELMSKCATKEHWLASANYGENPRTLLEKLYSYDKDDLLLNLASAKYWIEFWFDLLSSKNIDFVFVFSGSLTYAASLIEVMKGFRGRVFLFESFFTGRHYYCEEKYSHLPNNSDAKFKNLLTSRIPKNVVSDQLRLEKGIKEALSVKNKNVTQPPSSRSEIFNNDNKTILIGGQVLNDFSLLKTSPTGIHSISTYKSMIDCILDKTDLNIIFKAHPWENKKNNLFHAKTKQYISDAYSHTSRVAIVEDYAISDLFSEVDYVAVINSQLGIEAALQGFKPFQIGDAFYGKYGFTYDVDTTCSIVDYINNNSSGRLSVDEYILLREYLMHLLVDYLVPEETGPGVNKLKGIFNVPILIKTPNTTQGDDSKLFRDASVLNTSPNKKTPSSKMMRKLRKFKSNPKRFFSDSRFIILKGVGKLL